MSLVLSLNYQSPVLENEKETLARARAFGKYPPSSVSQAAKQAGQAAACGSERAEAPLNQVASVQTRFPLCSCSPARGGGREGGVLSAFGWVDPPCVSSL